MGEQDNKLDSINKNLTEILKAHNEKLNQIADLIKEVSKIQESNFNHMNERIKNLLETQKYQTRSIDSILGILESKTKIYQENYLLTSNIKEILDKNFKSEHNNSNTKRDSFLCKLIIVIWLLYCVLMVIVIVF